MEPLNPISDHKSQPCITFFPLMKCIFIRIISNNDQWGGVNESDFRFIEISKFVVEVYEGSYELESKKNNDKGINHEYLDGYCHLGQF